MALKSFLKFLISKVFLINVGIAIVLFLGILYGFNQWLHWYTHHNEALTVPDLKGMHRDEAEELLEKKDLEMVVDDSVYVPDQPELTVIEQQPLARSKVKLNRKIYLTVNSPNPPKVEIPDLTDVSLRQALKILKTKGFEIGDLRYVPGVAQNAVKFLEKDGQKIPQGKMLPKGTTIDLVLEEGRSGKKTDIPQLKGLNKDEASFLLKSKGLNFGSLHYQETVNDSTAAIIYKQRPLYQQDKEIAQGEAIDVWLTDSTGFKQLGIPDSVINNEPSPLKGSDTTNQ